jgi:hypothetical protein
MMDWVNRLERRCRLLKEPKKYKFSLARNLVCDIAGYVGSCVVEMILIKNVSDRNNQYEEKNAE